MRAALDTDILASAEGVNGAAMRRATFKFLEKLDGETAALPVQALGELFTVLVRKARRSPRLARDAILSWSDAFPAIETSAAVMGSAIDLTVTHRIGIWDAVVLAASASVGCRVLLSENMQDGFTWSGVTVVNPYSRAPHPLLAALLDGR